MSAQSTNRSVSEHVSGPIPFSHWFLRRGARLVSLLRRLTRCLRCAVAGEKKPSRLCDSSLELLPVLLVDLCGGQDANECGVRVLHSATRLSTHAVSFEVNYLSGKGSGPFHVKLPRHPTTPYSITLTKYDWRRSRLHICAARAWR